MNNKKVYAVLSAAAIGTIFSVAINTSVKADTRDFTNIKTQKVYKAADWRADDALFDELVDELTNNPDDYVVEFTGNQYVYDGLLNALINNVPFDVALQDPSLIYTPETSALEVSSVSAIDETSVTVVLAPVTEAQEGATIEIKDPSGNIVSVDPINLEVGDTEVVFNFSTPYGAGKLPLGVFTVEGKSFDTAAVAAVESVNNASNLVELWKALQSSYFTGAIEANITAYDTAITAGTPTTVAEVQAIIDEVNAASVSDEQQAAIVKTVADATNELQLVNALNNSGFVRVNADWILDYSTENVTLADTTQAGILALTATNYFGETKGATIKGIQDAIDAANVTKATAAVTAAEGTLVVKDVTDARALVNAYVPADVEGVTTKADLLDRLALHEAVVNVTLANTNAKLNSALNTLSGLTSDLDITTVNANELTRYRTDITAANVGDKDTAAKIQTLINAANGDAEDAAVTAVAAITAQTTPAQLKTLLTTLSDRSSFASGDFDIDTVVDSLLEDYRAAIVAAVTNDPTDVDTATEIQGIITAASSDTAALAALKDAGGLLTDADKLLTALKDKTLNLTVVDANKAAYFADIADIKTAANTDADAVQEVIDATNARLALNSATTTEAAKAALTNFAIATTNNTYINLSSTGKSEVAALVLAERPAAGYAVISNVTSAITAQDAARTTLIGAVNNAGPDNANTIVAMNTALTALNYAPYKALSSAEKVAVAEAFLNAFPTSGEPAVQVNYTTITAIEAAVDSAIAAAK